VPEDTLADFTRTTVAGVPAMLARVSGPNGLHGRRPALISLALFAVLDAGWVPIANLEA
jgi:hypothetical protein